MDAEITKTDGEWRGELTPAQYRVLREGGTERAFIGRVLGLPRRRAVPVRGVRRGAVRLGREVRVRHRLAELHRAGGDRGGHLAPGPHVLDGPHRGALPPLRLAPRPRLPRRTPSEPAALLHQLVRAAARARHATTAHLSRRRGRSATPDAPKSPSRRGSAAILGPAWTFRRMSAPSWISSARGGVSRARRSPRSARGSACRRVTTIECSATSSRGPPRSSTTHSP